MKNIKFNIKRENIEIVKVGKSTYIFDLTNNIIIQYVDLTELKSLYKIANKGRGRELTISTSELIYILDEDVDMYQAKEEFLAMQKLNYDKYLSYIDKFFNDYNVKLICNDDYDMKYIIKYNSIVLEAVEVEHDSYSDDEYFKHEIYKINIDINILNLA